MIKMNVRVWFDCPSCEAENSTDFDLGEHYAELGECEKCGHEFSDIEVCEIYRNLETQAVGVSTDRAMDRDR